MRPPIINFTPEKKKEYTRNYRLNTIDQLAAMYGVSRSVICIYNRKLGLRRSQEDKKKIAAKYFKPNNQKPRAPRKDKTPVGDIGYRLTAGVKTPWIMTEEGWVRLHLYTWKQAGNEIPEGYVLGFKDLDPANCELENLELKTRLQILLENRGKRKPKEIVWRVGSKTREKAERKKKVWKMSEKMKAKKEAQKAANAKLRAERRAERERAKEAERKARIEAKKADKVSREWMRAARKSRESQKVIGNRPLNLSDKIAVRIDHKTIIYVRKDQNIEQVIQRYKKAS